MRTRVVELDGLRGLAALLVVGAHSFGEPAHGVRAFAWAWIGVDIFFVLSGYLIGGIILDAQGERGFLGRFYLRRAARILPVYGLTVAAAFAAAHLFAGAGWVDHFLPLASYLTFTQNFALSGTDLGGWLEPTWTLAVEEQFYLIIPLVVILVPRHRLAPALLGMWVAAAATRVALFRVDEVRALVLLPGRADLLLGGVLAALAQRRLDLRPHLLALRTVPLVTVAGLLGVTILGGTGAVQMASPTLLGIGVATFILSLVNGAPEARRFRSPALRFFGTISYALYLVHQGVAGVLHGMMLDSRPDIGSPAALAVTCLALVVSVGIATASWYGLERPILRRARRWAEKAGHPPAQALVRRALPVAAADRG